MTVRSSAGILLIGLVVAIMVAGVPLGSAAQQATPVPPVPPAAPKASILGHAGAAQVVVPGHDIVVQLVIALLGLAAIIGIGLGVLAKLGVVTGSRPRKYYLSLD